MKKFKKHTPEQIVERLEQANKLAKEGKTKAEQPHCILSQSLAAGSFKDATRVAGTRPELVRQMLETNSAAVVKSIEEFMGILERARESLSGPEPSIARLADAGFAARTRLEARSGARQESVSPVKISSRPVLRLNPGGQGWVTQLRQAESMGGRIEI